jgi:hypothetical protein
MNQAKDTRVTMKVDRALWDSIRRQISDHPEWGILSVPEFIRRAVDNELRARNEAESSRVISLHLSPDSKGKYRKGP